MEKGSISGYEIISIFASSATLCRQTEKIDGCSDDENDDDTVFD